MSVLSSFNRVAFPILQYTISLAMSTEEEEEFTCQTVSIDSIGLVWLSLDYAGP